MNKPQELLDSPNGYQLQLVHRHHLPKKKNDYHDDDYDKTFTKAEIPRQKFPFDFEWQQRNFSRIPWTSQQFHSGHNNKLIHFLTTDWQQWEKRSNTQKNNNHNNTKKFPKLPARYVR